MNTVSDPNSNIIGGAAVVKELNQPQIPEPVAITTDVDRPHLLKRLLHLWQQLRKQGLRLTLIEAFEQTTRAITGAPTRRFSTITPQLMIGGQYLEHGWPTLKGRGVTAVVSMRGEFDGRKLKVGPERYCYLPTVDNHAPTIADLRQGAAFIDEEIKRGGVVYVHCWEGVGRAPTMAAAYLASTGTAPDDAWKQLRSVRPFIRPSVPQIQQVALFAAELHGQPAESPEVTAEVKQISDVADGTAKPA